MHRLAVAVILAASLCVGLASSCNQGEGERCQRQSDCSGNLVCNQATGLCQSSSSGADGNIQPDANVTADAPDADTTDADTTDAGPDAHVDATFAP